MASTTPSSAPSGAFDLPRSRAAAVAVAASVVQMLMMIPGYSEDDSFEFGAWLVVLAVSIVISVAIFLFAVPRAGLAAGLVLGVVGLASVLVFWAGITLPMPRGASTLALVGHLSETGCAPASSGPVRDRLPGLERWVRRTRALS